MNQNSDFVGTGGRVKSRGWDRRGRFEKSKEASLEGMNRVGVTSQTCRGGVFPEDTVRLLAFTRVEL